MQISWVAADDVPTQVARHKLLEAVRAAVARIGLKEIAFRLDVQPSLLADALAERSNKGVRAAWLVTIVMLADDHDALAILGALAEMRGLEVVKRKVLTPEEKVERLEEKLRSLGTLGLRLIQEAVGE